MTLQQAIQKAIEGGYEPQDKIFSIRKDDSQYSFRQILVNTEPETTNGGIALPFWGYEKMLFLDPLFWQALGKSLGWNPENSIHYLESLGISQDGLCCPDWLYHWHRFIDKLASGRTIEEFFQELS